MADKKVVSKRRRVVAAIVLLEAALLLFRWLIPARHHIGHDIIPLDMLIVVGCVLFMTYLLGLPEPTRTGEVDFRIVVQFVPAMFALCDFGLVMGTVMGSWLVGLYMIGIMAGIALYVLAFAALLVLGVTPQAARFYTWLFRPLVLLGRSRPVQAMVSYFNAENV
ncbi:MAG: hypothetical protein ACREGB_02750 [Candidatus Saccharimonadales bacterium]